MLDIFGILNTMELGSLIHSLSYLTKFFILFLWMIFFSERATLRDALNIKHI